MGEHRLGDGTSITALGHRSSDSSQRSARVVLDTRNLLDAVALRRRGWIYEGVGR